MYNAGRFLFIEALPLHPCMASTERIASMRAVTAFVVGIIAALVALSLGVIVVQNSVTIDVIFLGNTYQAPGGWLLLVFAGVGFVVAFLLLIPGRLFSAWRSWALSKQTHRLQDKLVDVQTQYALLEGELRLLRAERQQRTGNAPGASASPATTANSTLSRLGGADRPNASASPYPAHAPVAVAVAERPAAPVVASAPVKRKTGPVERMRNRMAMMRGQLKARVQRLRKRSPRRAGNDAASRQPKTGAPVR